MADKKISQLTGATTPLAGTEVLPIVQGGSTVKVSAANLTAGRATNGLTWTSTSAGGDTAVLAGTGLTVTHAGGTTSFATFNQFPGWGGVLRLTSSGSEFGLNSNLPFAIRDGSAVPRLSVDISNGNTTVNTGNLVFGTAGKGMTGGTVVTTTGQTSVPDSTATTIFALPSTTRVCSLQVFCNILDAPSSNSYVVIVYDRTNARIAVNGNDANLVISLSGSNVQVTQTFGTTQSVDWGYILSKNA